MKMPNLNRISVLVLITLLAPITAAFAACTSPPASDSSAWQTNGSAIYYTTGNVGIGTSSPSTRLHFGASRPSADAIRIDRNDGITRHSYIGHDNTGLYMRMDVNGDTFRYENASGTTLWALNPNTGNICGIDSAFEACSSDARLKQDVRDYGTGSLSKLRQLRPVTFTWNDIGVTEYDYEVGQYHTGFLAQDVIDVFPEWVSTDENGYYRVDDGKLRFVTLRAVQELAERNEALAEKIDALRAERDMLISRLEQQQDHLQELRAADAEIRARLDSLEGVHKVAFP